jgi:hypothetical protein
MCVTKSGDVFRQYLNSLAQSPATKVFSTQTCNSISIGARKRNTTDQYSGSYIDEVSVFNKALSQAEVNELFNSGVPTNLATFSATANLTNWWWMGDYDTYPTIVDQIGSADLTMTNMLSTSFVNYPAEIPRV